MAPCLLVLVGNKSRLANWLSCLAWYLETSADLTLLWCCLVFSLSQAEASQVMQTIASATEGYPFVPPAWAPSVLVPLTGLVLPAVAMASLFVWIEVCALSGGWHGGIRLVNQGVAA